MRVIKANDFSFDRRNKDYFSRKDNRTCERLLLIIGGGISSPDASLRGYRFFRSPDFHMPVLFSVITRFRGRGRHTRPSLVNDLERLWP